MGRPPRRVTNPFEREERTKGKVNMKKITVMAFLLALLAPMMSAWANGGGTTTYNYSATVSVTASGKGTVYVGQSESATDKTKKSDSQSKSGSEATSQAFTFWAFAEPDPGYEFGGWSEGADSVGSATSKVTVSLSSSATSKDVKLTATFNKVLTFDGDEYIIDENGGDLATLLGTVKEGDKIIIKKDVEIAKGVALTIPAGVQVSVSNGKTLTVKGSLTIHADARLVGDGTLAHNWKTVTQAAKVNIPFPLGTDGVAGTGAGVNTVDGTAGKYLVTSVKEENNVSGSFTCKEELFVTVENKASGKPYYSKPSTSKPVGILCTVAREKALNWIEGVSETVYTDCAKLLTASATPAVSKTHAVKDTNKLSVLLSAAGTVSYTSSANSSDALGFAVDLAGFSMTLTSTSKSKQWNSEKLVRFFNGTVTISQKVMNTNFCVYNMSGTFGYLSGSSYYTAISFYDSPNVKVTWDDMSPTTPAGGMNFYGGGTYGITPSGEWTANVSFNTTPSTEFNTVYWGTFVSGMDPSKYLYNANKVYAEQDKTQSNAWVVKEVYVDPNAGQVLVNGEESSLANAIANAPANAEIVLQKDVELDADLTLAASGVRIDLNGWKLTGSNAIINNGDLEIIDVNGNGQIDVPIINNGTLLLSSAKYNGLITLNSGFCYFLAGTFNGGVTVASSVEDAKSVAEVCGGMYATLTYVHGGQSENLVDLCDNGYVKDNAIAPIPVSYVTNPSQGSYSLSAFDSETKSLYTRNAARSGYTREEWIKLCKLKAASALFSGFGVDCAVTFDRDVAADDLSVTAMDLYAFSIDEAIAANKSFSALFQAMRRSGMATAPWTYGAILPGGQHDGSLSFSISPKSAQNGTLCLLEMRLATGIRNMSGPMDWSYTEYVATATRKFVFGAGTNKAMIRPEVGAATFYATLGGDTGIVNAVEDGGKILLANDCSERLIFTKTGVYVFDTMGFAYTGETPTVVDGLVIEAAEAIDSEAKIIVPGAIATKYVIANVDPVVKVEISDEMKQKIGISPTATPEQVQGFLKQEDTNKLPKWENFVLGQDGSKEVAIEAPTGGSEKTVEVGVSFTAPENTGYTVMYAFDKVDDKGVVVENGEGTAQATPTLDIESVTAENGLAYFKMRAVLEASDNSGVTAEVPVEKTIGVVKVASDAEVTIIPVPWQSLGDTDIKATELVHAASLSDKDELIVYGTDGKSQTWIVQDGKWTGPYEYTIGGGYSEPQQVGVQDPAKLKRGQGVILKRNDPSKEIVLIGQPVANEAEKVETPIAAASANEPSWNLVASPKMKQVEVGTVAGANTSDEIIVPTAGTPKHYTYKNNAWGYTGKIDEKEVTLPDGTKTMAVKFGHKTGDTEVPAGTGFWYLNKDSTNSEKKITW